MQPVHVLRGGWESCPVGHFSMSIIHNVGFGHESLDNHFLCLFGRNENEIVGKKDIACLLVNDELV